MPSDTAPLVFVDSCVYLDLIIKSTDLHPDLGEPRGLVARSLFRAVDEGEIRLAASALIEAEVACNGKAAKDSDKVRDQLRHWWDDPNTEWREVDRYIARESARLHALWHAKHLTPGKTLGSADATHLAVAVDLGCEYLFTYDQGYPHGHKVQGVTVSRPQYIWQQSLL